MRENLVTQINTVAYAAGLFFSPQRLSFDHDLPVYHSLFGWRTPISLLVLLTLLFMGLFLMRKKPFLGFGLCWFFLQILPTNSLIPRYDLLSERDLYLPSAGLFLALMSLWNQTAEGLTAAFGVRSSESPRSEKIVKGMLRSGPVVVAVVLLACTISRNTIYEDQVSFWLDAVRKSRGKARAHNNLGYAYYLSGDIEHAAREFRVASELDPGFSTARENLELSLLPGRTRK